MTGPLSASGPTEPAPAVSVDPELRTGAGNTVTLAVTLTNRAAEPRVLVVTALGVDTTWLPAPSRSRPVMPGESLVAELPVTPASGTVPARYPFAVAVQSLEPASGRAVATAVADIVLVVDEPSQIAIGLDPAAATAVFGRNVTLSVHNSGPAPAPVRLDVHAPTSARVHLAHHDVVVDPGQTLNVRARVRVARPRLFGQRTRHAYSVTARSAGSPRHVEGSLTVRAALGPTGTKALAMVAVVAVWVALAIVLIPKLSNHEKNKTVAKQQASSATASGSTSGNGSRKGAGGGSGKNGGSSGSGAGGGKKPGSSAAGPSVQFNGTVTGVSPGGVTVALTKTSLVDESVTGIKTVGVSSAAYDSSPIGKIPGSAVLLTPPRTVSQNRSTSTGSDGAWSFPSVSAPGYYELTFSKPGYQTQRYVLDSSAAVATQPLKVVLAAGQGSLHGTVRGPGGAVGAAQITITDGTNTITTSSNSKGDIGAWSVDGLSTPDSYLVSATKNGMSTESELVDLAAGGSSTIGLTLTPGVATLTGAVQGIDSTGAMNGLGNVAVTVTNGTVTRTASTITTGSLTGHYALPDLAPGSYTATVQAQGYQTQTRQVTISKGAAAAALNATLNSSAAVLTGSVTGPQFDNVTGAPITQNGASVTGPINGAGLILTNATNTYKITSGADGAFRLNGVAPGTYVLSAQYSGLITSYRTVTAVVGKTNAPVNFVLAPQSLANTSTITGYLGSATVSGGTLACPTTTPATSASPSAGASGASGAGSGTPAASGARAAVRVAAATAVGTAATPSGASPSGGSSPSGSLAPSGTASAPATQPCTVFFTLTDSDGTPVPTQVAGGTAFLATSTTKSATSGPTPYTLSAADGLAPGLYHLTIGSTGYLPATIAVRVPLNSVAVAPQVNLYPANIISGTINALGDVTRDGATDAATPKKYVNCVWAIPVGFSDPTGKITQPPTSCPTGADVPSQEGCSSLGHAAPGVSVIAADATYSIGGLCDGSYKVYVYMANPTYVSPSLAAVETVSHGQTLDYSPHVQRKGRVVLSIAVLDSTTGVVSPVTPATVTLTSVVCTPATPATTSPSAVDSNGRLIVSGLTAGPNGACVVSATDKATGAPLTGKVSKLAIAYDTDTAASIVFTRGLGTVFGRVVSPYGTTAENAVPGASVTVAGTVGYDGSDPTIGGPVALTTNAEGCFAIVHDATAAAAITAPSGCGDGSDLSVAAGTVAVLPLVTATTTVTVAATDGTYPYNGTVTLNPTTPAIMSVQPKPSTTDDLALTATDPATLNLSAASIQVTGTLPVGAGRVTVSADSSGKLLWTDSNLPTPGQAWPGTYTVKATLPGYTDATAIIDCPLPSKAGGSECALDSSTPTFSLVALGALSGRVSGFDKGTGTTTPLAGVTVTATCMTGSLAPCATAGATITATTDSSGNYSFVGTSTHFFMARVQWSLSVSATGYQNGSANVTITHGENSQNLTLNALGTLSGTISGKDPGRTSQVQPLPGATVILTCQSGSTAPCASGTSSITTVTDSSGRYSFAHSPVPYFMATGQTWHIAVSATGYVDGAADQLIDTGTNIAPDLALDALGTVTGTVTGAGAPPNDTPMPLPGATVTITCLAASQAPCATAGDKISVIADGAGRFAFTGTASPYFMAAGDWTFAVTAAGYTTSTTLGTKTIASGSNTVNLQLQALGALSGTVSGLSGNPLTGAQISATCVPSTDCPSGTATITTTTDLSGHYNLTGSANNYSLPLSNWTLTVTANGYLPGTASTEVKSGANTLDVPLTARGSLSGTITDLAGTAISGATVSATCTTGSPADCGPSESFTATTDSSGKYSIAGTTTPYVMTPGTWAITVKASGYSDQTLGVGGATTIAPGPNTVNAKLVALGSLSGKVSGLMAAPAAHTDQTKFTQILSGASVLIKKCSGDKSTCPSAALSSTDSGTIAATSDTGGNFTITGDGTSVGLATGGYEITVSAYGYQTVSTAVDVVAGANSAGTIVLPVKPVTLPIGIQLTSGGATSFTSHVTVKLNRVDDAGTSLPLNPSDADSTTHKFSVKGLIPATYQVTVTGDTSSIGSSIIPTVVTITVPLSDTGTTAEADIPVTVVQNTVTGVVTGLSGRSGTAKLGGVTVELGTLGTDGTTFTPSEAANGTDLTATSAATSGAVTFTGVPNGTYVARVNHVSPVNGYGPLTSGSVTVGYGQTQPLPTIQLPRVTQDVKIAVTTSSSSDPISSSTVTLVGASDTMWTFSTSSPSTSGNSTTWDLGQVPFGSWTVKLVLPSGHYGTLSPSTTSGGPALSCTTASQVQTCTSASGALTVSGDSTATTPVVANYDLSEYQPSVAVTATALALDTAPTAVKVTMGSFYANATFPVSSTATSLPVWVVGPQKITASVGKAGWNDNTFDASSSQTSGTIALTEAGASVTVTISNLPASPDVVNTATINLVAPSGLSAPGPLDATSGTVTFDNIPYGTGWKAQANVAYTIPGDKTTKPPGDDQHASATGDSASFDVSGPTVGPENISVS